MTMEGKNEARIPKASNNKTPIADAGLDQTVSEGSIVVLNGHGFTNDRNRKLYYSWTLVSDSSYNIKLTNDKTQNPVFKAPYIIDGDSAHIKPSIILTFQLKVSDDKGVSSEPSEVSTKVKRVQRAIIFQGGASLGAYEAGVLSALVEKLPRQNVRRPLFDIVAGTSIGSMNASIIVSHIVKENGTWDTALVEKLERFWRYQVSPTISDIIFNNSYIREMWDFSHNVNKMYKQTWDNILPQTLTSSYTESLPYLSTMYNFWRDYFIDGWYVPATSESARRYYSTKEFVTKGSPHVASGIVPWSMFGKFYDFSNQSNHLPRADNKHIDGYSLKDSLQQFVQFPIKTTEGQPRFLLVTVDVQTGDAITFDSYSDEAKYHNDTRNHIPTKNGIEINHVLASGTFPKFFDYPEFEVQSGRDLKIEKRIFWDGGFRSNTPLREVIQAHTDYWKNKHITTDKKEETEHEIPDLEAYIADLWPSELEEQPLSFDSDFVEDRQWDIIFGDRTNYDEKVANVVTDYVDLARQLKGLAKKKGASDDEISAILKKYTSSKGRVGQPRRRYRNMLEERFRLIKVVRIDRKDVGNEVHGKVFDYTYNTIKGLMDKGYRDTLAQIEIQSIKDGIAGIAKKIEVKEDKHNDHIEKLDKKFHLIQESIKVENSHNGKIKDHQLSDFIDEVKSLPDQVDGISIKEEKVLLVDAATGLK